MRTARTILIALPLTTVILIACAHEQAGTSRGAARRTAEALVTLQPGASAPEMISGWRCAAQSWAAKEVVLLRCTTEDPAAAELLAALRSTPGVRSAEPNYTRKAQ